MNTLRMRGRAASGFSLIELLVSMVIALVVTLAITSVLVRSEGSKRSTTSVNDVNQTGAYAAFVMDRSIRSAGSGFSQNWADAFGCVVDAWSTVAGQLLPLPVALDTPFATVPLRVRLAPILIGKGMADTGGQVRGDVLTVMAGMSGGSDQPQKVLPPPFVPGTARVTNALGYSDNDLVLLADATIDVSGATPRPGCMLQQVAAPTNPPQMLLYGVGDNSTLFSYDLLRVAGNTRAPTPIADGVVEMRALYGVDSTVPPDGNVDTWIDPGNAGTGYTHALLTDGTAAAQTKLRSISAVRIGLILRTSLQERDPIPTGSTLTLFSDLPAALRQTRTLAGNELYFRFRTVEFTVPLRNPLYAPPNP
jgi:type IV pilus assembly protein PilW